MAELEKAPIPNESRKRRNRNPKFKTCYYHRSMIFKYSADNSRKLVIHLRIAFLKKVEINLIVQLFLLNFICHNVLDLFIE